MKKFLILWLMLLLWLVTTTAALALDRCLKGPAFTRTGMVTVTACDPASSCDFMCRHMTATYIGTQPGHNHDGLWLTSTHAVGDAKTVTVWIDGHIAEVCAIAKEVARVECAGDVGWVVLRTTNYIPCGACPAQPSFDNICCREELFFVDIGKCGTVTKCHVTDLCTGSAVFKTDTLPDCPNCGAMAYDHCGRAIGLLVGGGKNCRPCGCGKERYTAFLRLTPEMFQCLEPQPADATATLVAARMAARSCQEAFSWRKHFQPEEAPDWLEQFRF